MTYQVWRCKRCYVVWDGHDGECELAVTGFHIWEEVTMVTNETKEPSLAMATGGCVLTFIGMLVLAAVTAFAVGAAAALVVQGFRMVAP